MSHLSCTAWGSQKPIRFDFIVKKIIFYFSHIHLAYLWILHYSGIFLCMFMKHWTNNFNFQVFRYQLKLSFFNYGLQNYVTFVLSKLINLSKYFVILILKIQRIKKMVSFKRLEITLKDFVFKAEPPFWAFFHGCLCTHSSNK